MDGGDRLLAVQDQGWTIRAMPRSHREIESALRGRILAGVHAPGSRFPLRRELLRELDASPVTLQRAMDNLTAQGFVRPLGKRGTFVADPLPNQGIIGLVMPRDPESAPGFRFWSALKRAAATWTRDGIRFRTYIPEQENAGSPGHRQLAADLDASCMAGVFFVSDPHWLAGTPVMQAPIPRVTIGDIAGNGTERHRTSYLCLGSRHVMPELLRRFAAQGRRRVAFLTTPSHGPCPWLDAIAAAGMQTRPEWWVDLPPVASESARAVARLLCAGPRGQRPDALVISDDNLVPHASAGILDAGLAVPQDLAVAAHANIPFPTHAPFPCLRYGPDVEELLAAGLAEIRRLAAGGTPRAIAVAEAIRGPG